MGFERDMAREFIEVCAMWARAFQISAGTRDEEVIEELDEEGNSRAIQTYRVRFASGFRITALSSVPRAFRGKQGIVILDEAAFQSQLDQKIKAALALLMWRGQVVIVSTHDGVANPFNKLVDAVKSGKQPGRLMTITFDDAVAAGLYERMVLVAATRGQPLTETRAEWVASIRGFYGEDAAEELDVIPSLGGGSLIVPQNLFACEHPEAGDPTRYAGGLHYVGWDVARRRDGQIIWGFELVGDVLWLRDRWEETKRTFAEQHAELDRLFAQRRIVFAGIDQTGMGEAVVEEAQRRHGATRVVGHLLNSGPHRLNLGLSLKQRFEEGKIRVPPDPDIRADLLAIKQTGTSGGGTRLVNDDGEVHADRFWAAAFASLHADADPPAYDYRPVRRPGAPPQRRDFHRPDHSSDWRPSARRRGY
jgi:phage FluMu gp28-like protein